MTTIWPRNDLTGRGGLFLSSPKTSPLLIFLMSPSMAFTEIPTTSPGFPSSRVS